MRKLRAMLADFFGALSDFCARVSEWAEEAKRRPPAGVLAPYQKHWAHRDGLIINKIRKAKTKRKGKKTKMQKKTKIKKKVQP